MGGHTNRLTPHPRLRRAFGGQAGPLPRQFWSRSIRLLSRMGNWRGRGRIGSPVHGYSSRDGHRAQQDLGTQRLFQRISEKFRRRFGVAGAFRLKLIGFAQANVMQEPANVISAFLEIRRQPGQ